MATSPGMFRSDPDLSGQNRAEKRKKNLRKESSRKRARSRVRRASKGPPTCQTPFRIQTIAVIQLPSLSLQSDEVLASAVGRKKTRTFHSIDSSDKEKIPGRTPFQTIFSTFGSLLFKNNQKYISTPPFADLDTARALSKTSPRAIIVTTAPELAA